MNGFSLKLIAMLFMLLDHAHTYLDFGDDWIALLPRFVAPLFVYFLVEGFFHTHDKKKYAVRLYGSAMIMFAGNILINLGFKNVNRFTGKYDLYSLIQGNNILWTLALFFTILMLLDALKKSKHRVLIVVGIIVLSIVSLMGEGGFYLLPLLYVFFFFYGRKLPSCMGVILFSSIIFIYALYKFNSGSTGETSLFHYLCYDSEWMMCAVCVPILLYNGEKGPGGAFAKWLFYVFYPVHLWIFYIICNIRG